MEVIRTVQVKLKFFVPDAEDQDDASDAVNAILDDVDYSFNVSDHHTAEGLMIMDTELLDYGEDTQKFVE